MLELFVNSKRQQFSIPVTLMQLLQGKNLHQAKGIAVAINDTVIPRSNWDHTTLSHQDRVTIITATQGG